jgi:hypothetical protein
VADSHKYLRELAFSEEVENMSHFQLRALARKYNDEKPDSDVSKLPDQDISANHPSKNRIIIYNRFGWGSPPSVSIAPPKNIPGSQGAGTGFLPRTTTLPPKVGRSKQGDYEAAGLY